jgi:hypothetical protein
LIGRAIDEFNRFQGNLPILAANSGKTSCDPVSLPARPLLYLFRHVWCSWVYCLGDVVLMSGVNGFAMTDDGDKREMQIGAIANKSGKGIKQERRQDRLKQALRENLKRRKSQARGRDDLTTASSEINDVSPYDDGSKKSGE